MLSLKNRKILILGGSSGIGLATAKMASQADAHVIIASRNEANRNQALQSLNAQSRGAYVDMANLETIDALIEAEESLDDVVFLPAAIGLVPFKDLNTKTVRDHFEHSFFAAWQTIKRAVPKMPNDGTITLITGALSKSPKPHCSHIIAAQWAMEGLMRGLVSEIAPKRINLIVPGLVDSPFWDHLGPNSKTDLFEATTKDIPVGKPAQPDEIAAMIIATIQNTFMNGATVVNDGGWSA